MDQAAFRAEIQTRRREIEAHCYRMLGSLADAEDALQETLLRAWKGLEAFEGRSSVRTWLYRIATNVCIDMAARRPARGLPHDHGEPSSPDAPLGTPITDPIWLDPAPRELWEATPTGPEALVGARESVEVAFLTLLHALPATQRAMLLLREVLGFSAAETAALLDTTVAAVNSGVQRARATLDGRAAGAAARSRPDDDTVRALLRRYVDAWETGAPDSFARLLREDALLTMPPIPTWFLGADSIARFAAGLRAHAGDLRFVDVLAAGTPAVASYARAPGDRVFRANAIHVVEWAGNRVARIDAFMIPDEFTRFGLSPELVE